MKIQSFHMSLNSLSSCSLSPSINKWIWFFLTVSLFTFTACERNTLRKEMEQNRSFSEIMKREDQCFIGIDAFFEKALINNPDPEIRQRAAIALGRIASPRALPLLYKALRTEDSIVRSAAIFAIGEIADREVCKSQYRNPDPHVVAELMPFLNDESLVVRMRTIEALGKIGSKAEALEIIRRLEQFRYDGQPVERAFIVYSITALARLNNPAAIPVLETYAATSDLEFQWRSLDALTRLQSKRSRDLFIKNLANPNLLARSYAARGIGMLGDSSLAGRIVPLLSPETEGQPNLLQTRSFALQALGDIRNPGTIPSIKSAIDSAPIDNAHPDQQNFVIQAAEVLGTISNDNAEPILLQLLRSPGIIADTAVLSLAKINKENPVRFFDLAAAHKLSEKATPRGWIQALAELGGQKASQELTRMLALEVEKNSASDADALPDILSAIAKTRSAESHEILAALFKSKDAAILRAAFSTYEPKAGSPEPWKPLLEALAGSASSSDSEARIDLFGLLQPWIRESPVQLALRVGLADDNYDVRLTCAALLRKAGAVGIPSEIPANRTITDDTCNLLALNRKHITLAKIETDRGILEVELFREDAPITSFKFSMLATEGAYDNMAFSKTASEQQIATQKLAPRKDFQRTIKSEINMRPIKRGSVGMALAGTQSDAGKLFIALQPQSYMDGVYTCFGHVISGMHVADQIVPGDHIRHITIKEIYPFVKKSDPSESIWHPLRGKGKLPK
jgi:peptidyl-prolyl cis-trans isomerase B (cyclophilin B)